MNVLLAGGANYIGIQTIVTMLQAGHNVAVVDEYRKSSEEILKRIELITGKSIKRYRTDLLDYTNLYYIMQVHNFDVIVHFCDLKPAADGMKQNLAYFRNKIDETTTLLMCMREAGIHNLVFSTFTPTYKSADPDVVNADMSQDTNNNRYDWTKIMMGKLLKGATEVDKELSVVLLHYYNVAGAHESGLLGDDPQGVPNQLITHLAFAAMGKKKTFNIFGTDYETKDGTCERDFIHVMDLAEAHLKAAEYAIAHKGMENIGLSSGSLSSVLQVIKTFENVNGVKIPVTLQERRSGDLPTIRTEAATAKSLLNWQAKRSLEDICRDAWKWHTKNPNGYRG